MKINDLFESEGLGLTIFDIDETLMRTTAKIKVVKDGKVIRSLTNQEFNNYKLQPGEQFDFGEFRNAEKFRKESQPIGPMIAKLKAILRNAGNSKVIMLTARADFDDKETFLDTFRDLGIDMSRVHVHRAGNLPGSPAEAKAVWIRKYLDTGKYSRVRLYDDSMGNIRMFNALAKEYPNVKFFPYLVTHDGGVKTVREARSFSPQVTPLQSLINEYLFFSSFGTMEAPGDAKSPDSEAKLNDVITRLAQSNKSLQNLDKQKLEINRDKILNHIHDMMKYAIAHLREHLPPEKFDEKKKQINSVLTKYNTAASTKENFSDSKKKIQEVFDQPSPIQKTVDDAYKVEYTARIKRKKIDIEFEQMEDGVWEVIFYVDQNISVTGKGDQYKIFATVLSAINSFINERSPYQIEFESLKFYDRYSGTDSGRTKLYISLIKRFAQQKGYISDFQDSADTTTFILKKIRPTKTKKTKVAEVLNTLNYSTPNFEHEWEEAERYPEFRKIGKSAWMKLAASGKAVTIRSAKDINNTDAADPNSFKLLDKWKQSRALDQLKSGIVEMPIIALYPDGYKELIGGNTRLTAMMAQNGEAKVWIFSVPDKVAKLAEQLKEDGRIVKGVNTTVDVGPDEIKRQAAKFGNTVDKDGYPPTINKAVKGKSTNVLYNLGLAEGVYYSKDVLIESVIYEGFLDSAKQFLGNKINQTAADIKGAIVDLKSAGVLIKDIVTNEEYLNKVNEQLRKQNINLIKQINRLTQENQTLAGVWNRIKELVSNFINTTGWKGFLSRLGVYGFLRFIVVNTQSLQDTIIDTLISKLTDLSNIIPSATMGGFLELFNSLTTVKEYFFDVLTSIKNKLDFGKNIQTNSKYTPMELSLMEGGHTLEDTQPKKPGDLYVQLENFADGKNPGRKGLAKRMGVNTKASVSSLRKTAKNSSGEKARMAHWLANMKSGQKKK